MSNEDPYRPNQGRDRGAYTPPTDDDLPFDRQSYDPRRGGGGGGNRGGGGRSGPPITLIISVLVLLALAVGVFFMYFQGGLRASEDAPAAVGTPVGPMTAEVPVDAQPVDPEAGIDVYSGANATPPVTDPTYAPPPEEVGPRPAPQPIETPAPLPPVAKRPTTPAPAPAPTPAPTTPPKTEPSAVPAGGSSAVQIGAFSTPSLAEREYNAVVSRYPRLVRGASRRVQEVTTASGATVYRTTVTNLSREQATGLCAAIRDGGGDCLVR